MLSRYGSSSRPLADRGIYITTSRFTPDADSYADRVQARVILIDGDTLGKLMVTHNIGVLRSRGTDAVTINA